MSKAVCSHLPRLPPSTFVLLCWLSYSVWPGAPCEVPTLYHVEVEHSQGVFFTQVVSCSVGMNSFQRIR